MQQCSRMNDCDEDYETWKTRLEEKKETEEKLTIEEIDGDERACTKILEGNARGIRGLRPARASESAIDSTNPYKKGNL